MDKTHSLMDIYFQGDRQLLKNPCSICPTQYMSKYVCSVFLVCSKCVATYLHKTHLIFYLGSVMTDRWRGDRGVDAWSPEWRREWGGSLVVIQMTRAAEVKEEDD